MFSKKAQALDKVIRNTSNIFNLVGVCMLFVLMLQGAADVIGRYLFNKPIIGTMERGELLLALMVFLSWGHTQIKKGHVNVELFISRFPPRAQAITNFATTFLALVLFSLIAWQGALSAKATYESGRLVYVIHWPLAPFQFFVPLGALILCLVLIVELVQYFFQMKGRD